jgi:AcrR family transcriptional regulator
MAVATTSKKQNIINIAAGLFRKNGYKATSIRDLAAAVGIEPSSIYSHVSSKEEILAEICLDSARRFSEGMDKTEKTFKSPADKLHALIQLHLEIAYVFPGSIVVFNGEWKHLPDDRLKEFITSRKNYETRFKSILEAGKNQGVFTFDNAEIVFNIIIQSLTWPYEVSRKYGKAALQSELTNFIMRSLNKNP